MGKTAGRARFARIGIAVAVLVVLAGIGVALAATVGGLSPAGGSNALVVEEPMGRPQDTLEAEPEAPADAAAQEAPVEKAAPPAPTPSTTGALKVTGAQLTDAAGEPVQLRGVSTHGLAWYPQYVNQEFFTELRDVWGANVVRLATYSAEEGGYATETGDRTALNDLVVRGVQYAQAADLYAVVDWHTLSDANPATNQWAAEEFFRSVSGALGNTDNVIYEICNEPNGGTSWADIKAYAEAVIPIIRANDPDAIIVVGTPTWSQDLAAAAADRWEEGGRTFFRYEMAGSNYSAGVKSWSVVVPFNGEVTLEDAWNCKASASGTRLTVANDAHNGNVPAGGFVRDVGFIVSGPADLAVVEYE